MAGRPRRPAATRSSPDGIERSAAVERQLNEAVATAFRGAAGKAALDYLRSISIERVAGPHIGDGELRHLEGMRYIVGIISQRIAHHHRDQERHVRPDPANPSATDPDAAA